MMFNPINVEKTIVLYENKVNDVVETYTRMPLQRN